MVKRHYRTSRGQTIDFEAMRLANERVPAIGNMNVNARGDEIKSDGTILKSREDIMKEYYKINTQVPTDSDVPESSAIKAKPDIVEQQVDELEGDLAKDVAASYLQDEVEVKKDGGTDGVKKI